jgi:putative DNA methylase
MTQPKKLIEVAMPVKEVSAESVRDKSIRHGHISTLHLWWARRPLPVCRAVVFASLVPDPLDENCPAPFKQAVAKYLADNKYKPYDDIPHTAAIDPMEDNLRNRLLMFIGKFSDEYVDNEKSGKITPSKKQLSDGSLIKWENKNNPEIIGIARKLIFIAHNTLENGISIGARISSPDSELVPNSVREEVSRFAGTEGLNLPQLEKLYNSLWTAITTAEKDLYTTPNRHLETTEIKAKEKALHDAIENYLDHMPRVFDPFAGGGAIPLEAARLGCRTFGNDINPVAHIIQRGSVEFPQKYGKPITYTREAFLKQYPVFAEEQITKMAAEPNYNYSLNPAVEIEGYDDAVSKRNDIKNATEIHVKNRLAFDVEYYARQMLAEAEKEIGHYYPEVNGRKPIAYYWTRVGTCSNPSCRAEVPLLKQFYLANKKGKQVHLNPVINGTEINFEIKTGEIDREGWMTSRSLKCPCCGNATAVEEIKKQSVNNGLKEKLIAVIEESEKGKNYRLPLQKEKDIIISDDLFDFSKVPTEKMQEIPDLVSGRGWGIRHWYQMFSRRQLLAMQTFVNHLANIKEVWTETGELTDYQKGVVTYLGIWIDRLSPIFTTFGRWDTSRENLQHPFSRQAIPMIFDYPEGNPFSNVTGSASNQLVWITRYIIDEFNSFTAHCNHTSSGEINQFKPKYLNAVITDPPYYDAIAYADLADFFYVWLKRTLGDVFPFNFATPQTPKTEECTALKHHHEGKLDKAKQHFENKLQQIFTAIEQQTSGVVSIMFAHQSTEAWTTLVNSILGSNMNITGSWPFDSEMGNRMIAMEKLALASSVTVSCRPNIQEGCAGYKQVKSKIENRIKREVGELYANGFRGADLLTACFGKAVSEFGEYKTVEKADGTPVTVSELLELARDAAFNAIISDIDTDDVTKFYIGWLNLFGFTQTEHDDVMRITQVGLSVEVAELHRNHVFETSGNKESLSGYKARCKANQKLGTQAGSYTIDKIHKAMSLYELGNRPNLVEFLGEVAPSVDAAFWRVCTAVAEVLPPGYDDHKQLSGLMANKESLTHDAQRGKQKMPEQGKFEL